LEGESGSVFCGLRPPQRRAVNESDWDQLLWAIEEERCTPFLGAGACVPALPTGFALAQEWAAAHGYPLEDGHDLARVAEYLAVEKVPMAPKYEIRKKFQELPPPPFEGNEPHAVMARLPIPVYLTTNYVDYMAEALRQESRNPRVDFCRWTSTPAVKNHPSQLPRTFVPTVAEPVVYHLHGHIEVPQSLVLTETDYVSFLVELSRRRLLPHQIERALANGSLIFLGYGFRDWDFRVIFRGLVAAHEAVRELGVTVQLETDDEASRRYLENYFDELDLRVYWGDGQSFARDLREKWETRRRAA
jgi:SIR2-like domain